MGKLEENQEKMGTCARTNGEKCGNIWVNMGRTEYTGTMWETTQDNIWEKIKTNEIESM